MKSSPASVVGILERLSVGVSRVSIRHGHTTPKRKQPRPELTGFRPGLGEQIWVHHHIAQGMIIYTHEPELPRDSHKALSQIPYTVKKQKPAALRHDYWAPLCLIEVPKGLGVVGRNVMQKLREFRHRHELEWGWQAEELISRSRRGRGELILNQRSNSVADIAAVLAGAGRGNRMWTTEPLQEDVRDTDGQAELPLTGEAALENNTATAATPAPPARPKPKAKANTQEATLPKTLTKANIYWSNDADRHWASEWSENVTHFVGLPSYVTNTRFKTKHLLAEQQEEPPEPDEVKVADADATTEADAAPGPEPEKKPQGKKGFLGFLAGKLGRPTQDARV